MTNAFNAKFDARAVKAFADIGLADDALYTPNTGGTSIACKVYIDRTVSFTDAAGNSVALNDAVTVTAFAADIGAAPLSGAAFVVGTYAMVDAVRTFIPAERFTVDAISNKDESRFVCLVKTGF